MIRYLQTIVNIVITASRDELTNLMKCGTVVVMSLWCDHELRSTALSVDRWATPAPMNTNNFCHTLKCDPHQ